MSKLFDIVNISKNRPIIKPKPECWLIKPIRDLIEAFPENYPKIIAFLHFMNSYRIDDNPYADVPYPEREEQIIRELELDIDSSDPIIASALESVALKYESTFYILYKGIKEYLNKAGRAMALLNPDFNGKDGNIASVRQFIKEYNAMSINFKQAYRDFDEEIGNSRIKGGGRAGYDEDDDDELSGTERDD